MALIKSVLAVLLLLASLAVISAGESVPSSSSCSDYIIVGGGVAGFVLAYRLSANPNITVHLLEAGPDPTGNTDVSTPGLAVTVQPSAEVFNYTSSPQAILGGRTPAIWQGHGFGGGSSANYMQYCRGAPSVFDDWANVTGDSGWEWTNFLPYFKKTTHLNLSNETYSPVVDPSYYGDGPLEISYTKLDDGISPVFVQAMEGDGIPQRDMNAGNGIGSEFTTQTIRQSNATRDSSFTAFGPLLAARPNVRLQHGALVSKINFSRKTANSVTYINMSDNSTTTIDAKEIIVSSGAINTPKLLKLSGVGPEGELAKFGIDLVADIPAIGQNMYDHHFVVIAFNLTSNIKTVSSRANLTFLAQIQAEYRNDAEGPLAEPLTMCSAWRRVPDDVLRAANATYQISLPADRPHVQFQCSTGPISIPVIPGANQGSCLVALVAPEASGSVTLASASIYDSPIIDTNYFGSQGDKASILWGYKHMLSLLKAEPLNSIIVNILRPPPNATTDDEIWQTIQQTASDFYHPTGTVRLGEVIGHDFRIKGLNGIRVVDSSIIPVMTSCYTQSVTYAIAERAADVILREHGHGWNHGGHGHGWS